MGIVLPFADVIWPALATPYFIPLFFPYLILGSFLAEWLVVRAFWAKSLSNAKVFSLVLLGNIASCFVGGVLLSLPVWPTGLEKGRAGVLEWAPSYKQLALAGFLLAYVLTILIEWGVYSFLGRRFPKTYPISRVALTTVVSNAAGYALLILFWYWGPR